MSEITARCPFCGSDDLRVKPVWKTWHFVACNNCKAGGPVRKTETEAIEAFEQRIEEKRWQNAYEQQEQLIDRFKRKIEELLEKVCPCLGQGGYELCRAFVFADKLTRKMASDQMIELSVESAKLTQELWREDLAWFENARTLIKDMYTAFGSVFEDGRRLDFELRMMAMGIEFNDE